MHIKRDQISKAKVVFELDKGAWHGYETETLWCERMVKGTYRVANTPFFATGLSYGDIIAAEEIGGILKFKEIVSHTGHSTYRMIILRDNSEKKALVSSLNDMGCYYESADNLLKYPIYALDIPKSVDVHTAYELLEIGESKGLWEFEEGHYQAQSSN